VFEFWQHYDNIFKVKQHQLKKTTMPQKRPFKTRVKSENLKINQKYF